MRLCYRLRIAAALAFVLTLALPRTASAADWPQFMRSSAHTGDAADEVLRPPLGLVAQVKLEDAIMTSPVVVAGRAYVVDQMGTAYCIDPRGGRVVWKASPDGKPAMGPNTSSPCLVQGRLYYGTTAGTFHILDARDGRVLKTLDVGAPIVSSPTFANDSIYFQALDAVLRCLDRNGNERWNWDHYARYKEPPEVTKSKERERGHPGSYDRPHYGGGDVAAGKGPALIDSEWLDNAERLVRLVLHGVRGPITVNGEPFNRDSALDMPGLYLALDDEKIAGVLTFVRREWRAGAAPIQPATARRIRAATAGRTEQWTEQELLRIK
ncbi:MAG: PQQ-binding-like beta-propeller repeat protein [Gemmataceae bacterium]|nr:PQQ-binding-like beta-propeller repeat protein [Gemmataceae bacterium]